jgi:hypothetical protein
MERLREERGSVKALSAREWAQPGFSVSAWEGRFMERTVPPRALHLGSLMALQDGRIA